MEPFIAFYLLASVLSILIKIEHKSTFLSTIQEYTLSKNPNPLPKETCPFCDKKIKWLKRHLSYCKKRKRTLSEEQSIEPPTQKRKTYDPLKLENLNKKIFSGDSQEVFPATFDTSSVLSHKDQTQSQFDDDDDKLSQPVFDPFYYDQKNPFPLFGEKDWT